MSPESLVFYTNPRSRGRIVRWMLEEVGAPYRTEVVEFRAPMKSDNYLSINPMGKVPTIVHEGAIVTEAAAVCAYLADAFPEAGLAPRTSARADYYRWLFFAAGPVEAAVTNTSLGVDIPGDRQGMVGYGNFELVVDTLAAAVSKHPFIAGDAFSAADVYVGPQVGWGLQVGTLPQRDEFQRYWEKLANREAYRRATELDERVTG